MVYSNIVRDHFACPRNVGELKNPTAVGRAKNEADGDQIQIHLRIKDGKITEAMMKVMGCVAAIASASLLTELIKGKTTEEARTITRETLSDQLGGLPDHKVKCSLTCIDALKNALMSLSE